MTELKYSTVTPIVLLLLPLVTQQCRSSNISKDSSKATLLPSIVRSNNNDDYVTCRTRLLELEGRLSILEEELNINTVYLERERLRSSSLLKQKSKQLEKITRQQRDDETSIQHYLSDYVSNKSKTEALVMAARRGDLPVMKQLIHSGVNASAVDHENKKRSLLHWAVVRGNIQMAQTLIEHGADLEAREAETMQTPLHLAANLGKTEIAEILLKSGAHVDARSAYKRTPLHWSAAKGHFEMAKLLVRYGADPLIKDNFRNTPYAVALRGKYMELAQWLDSLEKKDIIAS